MKFISFIASSMLLVLINQHSIMGLPVKITVGMGKCSEGFEMINGKCVPMDSMTDGVDEKNSPKASEEVIIHEDQLVTELNMPKKSGACPEGMEHGEHGICEEIEPSKSVKVTLKSTTDRYENSGGVEKIKGCPEGTEADEQGACQEIKPSKPKKMITDPKTLLKEDGSCPDNYKMIEGRCLYIKSKTNSTLYPDGSIVEESVSIIIRPKTSINGSSKVELVPVLADNSCPEGTEYGEYGLCEKHNYRSDSDLHVKPDGSCPDNFELINGKCTYKNSKAQGRSTSTTTPRMTRMSKSTTPAEDVISNEEYSTSTYTAEPDYERKSKLTTTPRMMRMLKITTPAEDSISKEEFSTSTFAGEPEHERESESTTTRSKMIRMSKSTTPAVNINSNEEFTTSTGESDHEQQLRSTTTTSSMMRISKSTTAEDATSKEQFSTSTSTAEPDSERKSESTTITSKIMRIPSSTTPVVDTTSTEDFSTSTFTAAPEHERPSESPMTTSNMMTVSENTSSAFGVISKEELSTSATTGKSEHEGQSETTSSPL